MSMPPAPYPPHPLGGRPNNNSNSRSSRSVYSNHVTSSASSSPHYSEEQQYASSQPGTRSRVSGSGGSSSSSRYHIHDGGSRKNVAKSRTKLPASVEFVPGAPYSDLYGAINCPSVDDNGYNYGGSTKEEGGRATTSSGMKEKFVGPSLLEIRRLKYSLDLSDNGCNDNDNDEETDIEENSQNKEGNEDNNSSSIVNNDDDDDEKEEMATAKTAKQTKSSFYQHESILISRGLPGLGLNVSSTCLNFQPTSNNNQSSSSESGVVRCATGLTSGALCIHTISNLYRNNQENNEDASSTVAVYAPRQQRPATSVAWRTAKNSNLVAIGLVGSGGSSTGMSSNSSTHHGSSLTSKQSKMASAMGVVSTSTLGLAASGVVSGVGLDINSMGGGISSSRVAGFTNTPTISSGFSSGGGSGHGGDRDFGTLVWDIEAQSSIVSGAGTLGGSSGSMIPVSPMVSSGKKGTTSVGGVGKSGNVAVPIKSKILSCLAISFLCGVYGYMYNADSFLFFV